MTRLLALPAALMIACFDTGTFECVEDADCVVDGQTGVCEDFGGCSFDDSACPSGRRIHDSAPGDRAGQCALTRCVDDIASGSTHTCAVREGQVWCWGNGAQGALGFANSPTRLLSPTMPVFDLSAGESITLGDRFSCALDSDGTASCWGAGVSGQIGNGVSSDADVPKDVDIERFDVLSAGTSHVCGIAQEELFCWGDNNSGKLGVAPSTVSSNVPLTVAGLPRVVAVSAGDRHTCAISTSKELYCWGNQLSGKLGDGINLNSAQPIPTQVASISDVVAVAAGFDHTCAIVEGGRAECWGANTMGQVGNGQSGNVPILEADEVQDPDEAVAVDIDAGDQYACALYEDGGVRCWGNSGSGRLGSGAGSDQTVPSEVVYSDAEARQGPIRGIVDISAGATHSCVIEQDGDVLCWGANGSGELGIGKVGSENTAISVIDFECDQPPGPSGE